MFKNNKLEIVKLQKKLKHKLSDTRYQHTLGVSYTAGCLAMRYGEDIDKAMLAGLLHDCAKYMTPDDMLKMALNKKIEVTEIERVNPELLHAKLGSYFAIKKYHIKDKEINDAVLCHITGKPGMTTFEKILFISDYIEAFRVKMPRLDVIRKEAFIDIDSCLRMILEDTLSYLKSSDSVVDEMTQKTYDFYNK